MDTPLVTFLRARLDDDERIARAVPVIEGCKPPAHWAVGADPGGKDQWVTGTFADIDACTPEAAVHVARHDPARTLAEVTAKRTVVELYAEALRVQDGFRETGHEEGRREALELACRAFASSYEEHRSFRSEWRLT